jgi:hypothetical protein
MDYKKIVSAGFLITLVCGCNNRTEPVVNAGFIDSLITHYSEPAFVRINQEVMGFWKDRIHPKNPGLVSESKYAGALATSFHYFGDIRELKEADSVMRKVDSDFNHREGQANLTLLRYSIMQHRFREADNYLQKAKQIGLKKYDVLTSSFDVDFELGRYSSAGFELKEMHGPIDYGYFFRRSKLDHLHGMMDSSIHAMLRAASLEPGSEYLEQVAFGSVGDLYLHAAELRKAADYYIKSLRLGGADFHSLLGLGWIALVKDKNYTQAEKIFAFVQQKNKLPDPILKLSQLEDAIGDSLKQKQYARQFEKLATNPIYGNMYNKYLIELYTNILQEPVKAAILSRSELDNRATPQTYAWYAWSLFCNNRKQEAYAVFQRSVSGQPLEGLELYWMGKLMQGLNKGYNANQFFQAAYKNKYDLSPGILRDLEKQLEE